MQEYQKVRFLTINYSNLQGLRAVPTSLLLLLVVLWVNLYDGGIRSIPALSLIGVSSAVCYWLIDRYYKAHYGKVEKTTRQLRTEIALGVIGGLAGLVAVIVDLTQNYPISLVGLVFAGAVVAEFLRAYRFAKSGYIFWQAVISFFVLLTVNFLPILGLANWSQTFGIRSDFLAVLVVTSLVILLSGIFGHIYFVHQFQSEKINQ